MKRTEYFKLRSAARLVMAVACILVLAAACTTDDDPSRPDNADAPVPFTFTAVAPPAMTDGNTRALPGNDEWKGDSTEKIKVRISVNRNFSKFNIGTYTVISPDGKTAVLPGDEPALWPSKDEQYVIRAWYPALELNKVYDIRDQSTPEKLRQADVLRAEMSGFSYDINFTPDLTFKHQMAKVRVELTGVNASATDIKVYIRGSAQFNLNDYGYALGDISYEGYITACRDTGNPSIVAFEAVLPSTGNDNPYTKQNFIRITTGGRTYYFTPGAGLPNDLYKGELYTYTVDIPSPPTSTTTAPASHLSVSTPIVNPFNTSER